MEVSMIMNVRFPASRLVAGLTANVASWQCAPQARIISGGRFHLDNGR